MKKWLRFLLVAVIIATVATAVLSLSAFGGNEDADASVVTPTDGVYVAENASQLIWIFNSLETKSIPLSSSIRLANDIDVDGKLPTLKKVFSGVFDGNGKTLSGVSNLLFNQFNGTAKNLTIRAKSGVTVTSASFARKLSGATLTNIVSYADLTVAETDVYVGGISTYAEGKMTITDCAYYGEYKIDWKQNNIIAGGIVGYINPDTKTVTIDGCYFGGKMTVTGGVAGRRAYIGGIIGQSENGSLVMKNCASKGEILSQITDGDDYVGGIFAICEDSQKTIEYCSNMSSIQAVKNAGGILGGITTNAKIMSCTNFTDVKAASAGSFCGNGGNATLTCFSSYDFAKTSNKFCSTAFVSNSSYASGDLTLEKEFTLGNNEYAKYNVGTIDKETGLLIRTLKTHKMFEALVSVRDDGEKQAVRFVILTNGTCNASSITATISFRDFGGKVMKSYTGILGGKNSNMDLYYAVAASGANYFAGEGCSIFGCVITDVPVGVWDSAELTIADTNDGTVYLEPVELQGYTQNLTMDMLPDLSALGTVSEEYNCGPGLASDQGGYTNEDSFLKVISETSKEKFDAYIESLTAAGFGLISKITSDGDDYYSFSKYGRLLYVYYSHRINEVRVICDNSSDALSKISYDYQVKEGETLEFYQYSINYTENNQKGFDPVEYTEAGGMNCGMLYFLKTADNKLIMIDGGYTSQMSATAKKHLLNYLYEITGTPAKEKITIATWFITHAHGDHTSGARDFISSFHNNINLESVIFNFPSYQVISGEYDANTFTLKEVINRYYPNVLYHKLHTGEEFSLGGIDVEVLYTHEDSVGTNGVTRIVDDFNSTSTVLRFTLNGKTFTILGDINKYAQETIVALHSGEYMKSDLVQAAHHGYNYIGQVYKMISAEIVVFPQSMRIAKGDCVGQYKDATVNAKETYFAHKWTYKFTVENGVIKSTEVPRYDQK